jgi:hypothetical protein
MFGLGLVDPIRGFPADFLVIMPMHTAEQRSLPRILANAVECTSVALSGEGPITALGVTIRPSLGELFLTDWEAGSTFPLDPQADVDRTPYLASAVIEGAPGDSEGVLLIRRVGAASRGEDPASMPPPPLMAPSRGTFKPAQPPYTS